jgi:A/G-specific adenine glycosylase
MLLLRDPQGRVLLERRPPQGVWGGLWGLPELHPEQDPGGWCERNGFVVAGAGRELPARRHSFTHFHLQILAREIPLAEPGCGIMDGDRRVWYNLLQPDARGLAAPIARLLQEVEESEETP